MNRITASKLSTLAVCPSVAWLRQLVEPTSKYAEIGNAAHEYLLTGIERHDTFLEVPRFDRPEQRTLAEVRHEWRFGWNFKNDSYVAVPMGATGRDYGDYPASEWVMGSADAMWVEGGVLYMEDLKTGAPQEPTCEQLVFLAYCAARAGMHTGDVSIQILNATRYGYKTRPADAGVVSLRARMLTMGELEVLFESMVKAPMLAALALEAGGEEAWQAAANPGRSCFFCSSKAYCPKFRAKATPKNLEYMDKLRAAQENNEQSKRNESSGQGDNGTDTGGHDGGGAGEREAPGVHETQ